MTTKHTAQHMPGAMRAARTIIDAMAAVGLCSSKIGDTATDRAPHYQDLAAIIDRETAAPELYEALKRVTIALEAHITEDCRRTGNTPERQCPCTEGELEIAHAALAKVTNA